MINTGGKAFAREFFLNQVFCPLKNFIIELPNVWNVCKNVKYFSGFYVKFLSDRYSHYDLFSIRVYLVRVPKPELARILWVKHNNNVIQWRNLC